MILFKFLTIGLLIFTAFACSNDKKETTELLNKNHFVLSPKTVEFRIKSSSSEKISVDRTELKADLKKFSAAVEIRALSDCYLSKSKGLRGSRFPYDAHSLRLNCIPAAKKDKETKDFIASVQECLARKRKFNSNWKCRKIESEINPVHPLFEADPGNVTPSDKEYLELAKKYVKKKGFDVFLKSGEKFDFNLDMVVLKDKTVKPSKWKVVDRSFWSRLSR